MEELKVDITPTRRCYRKEVVDGYTRLSELRYAYTVFSVSALDTTSAPEMSGFE